MLCRIFCARVVVDHVNASDAMASSGKPNRPQNLEPRWYESRENLAPAPVIRDKYEWLEDNLLTIDASGRVILDEEAIDDWTRVRLAAGDHRTLILGDLRVSVRKKLEAFYEDGYLHAGIEYDGPVGSSMALALT
jgi:hypothetical protein